MRLNIGCGLVYKKGYINIDAFDTTVADQAMEAHSLDFDDCVADAIECRHLIEHLGLGEAIYSLSEFLRVLRPDGRLLIRTPDIETSYETFLKSGSDKRRYLLNWIYGIDRVGMNHKYGYPVELLEMLLADAGFTDIKVKRRGKGTTQPEAALTCRKPKSYEVAQLISRLRRSLVDASIVDVHDQVTAIDYESLVSTLLASITRDRYLDTAVLIDTTVRSPSLARIWLANLHDTGHLKEAEFTRLTSRVSDIEKAGIIEVLVEMLKELPLSLPQHQAYDTVRQLAQAAVRNVLGGTEAELALETMSQSRSRITDPEGIGLFTEQSLKSKSLVWLARGIKTFAVGQLIAASDLLERALRLDRDSSLAAWNLARATYCTGNRERALELLAHCESLEKSIIRRPSRGVADRINADRTAVLQGELGTLDEPVYEIG